MKKRNLLARLPGDEDIYFFEGAGIYDSLLSEGDIEEAYLDYLQDIGEHPEKGDTYEVSEDGGETWFEVEVTDIDWTPTIYTVRMR